MNNRCSQANHEGRSRIQYTVQLQTHVHDDVVHMCHTSCGMLDAGPLVDFFIIVARWLATHPNEVMTILIGNGDNLPPSAFSAPLVNSSLAQFVYIPPTAAMTLDAWPTLGAMIDANTRCVVMLDYGADYAAAPWLMGEFHDVMWETPFSPTDPTFPCVAQRPSNQPRDDRLSQLILMNHNLNSNWSVEGAEILVPAILDIDKTNADHGRSSVGAAMDLCTETWGRPPNFLLVDFYERGNFALSALSVAARANGVSWQPPQVSAAKRSLSVMHVRKDEFAFLVVATIMFSGAAVRW